MKKWFLSLFLALALAVPAQAETVNSNTHGRDADGNWQYAGITSNALDVNIKSNAASNSSVNVAQINGVTPLMGAGNTGTGSPRVTIATDQAAFSVNVGTFPDNEPVNVAQVGGTAIATNSGVVGAGTQRVVLATDVALPAGTNTIGKLSANSGVDIGDVDVTSIAAGNNNIGDVDVASVPTDPFGANADAASATGSISAKLRFIAATGIPVTSFPDNEPINVAQMNGVAVTMGNGAAGTGVQRVTIASDSTGTIAATQSGTWTVQPGNTANTTPWLVTQTPATSGGLSVFNGTSSDGGTALTNSAQAIKASAGQVFGWYIYNPNATAQYVQFYNVAAASVTVGTTNPLFMLTIPATSGANVEFSNGIVFSNAGFSCAATSTAGGNGAPSTALEAVVYYK